MCNDNLSGIVISTFLAKYLIKIDNYYTYRFIFIPETIGAITYLKYNLETMKQNTVGGYVITCIGDKGDFTYLQTRKENQITDKVTIFTLDDNNIKYKLRKYYTCGSDERQYNYPGVDLNIGSLMRTKYLEFNEYHTSADNLSIMSENNLRKSLKIYKKCLYVFENNFKYKTTTICEPRLGIHGLWNNIGGNKIKNKTIFRKILYYCDGKNDVIDICKILNISFKEINKAILILFNKELLIKI